jgi:hypothetical protein
MQSPMFGMLFPRKQGRKTQLLIYLKEIKE